MSSKIISYISPEEYLKRERQSEFKSEYLNGEIFAMTGASRKHNLITTNLSSTLNQQLKGKPGEVYSSDMRVKVSFNGLYTYPDVVVVCGEPIFEDGHVDTLLNPTVLVEVLSKSTEYYDRVAKTTYYRRLDSLKEHLFVAQEEVRLEQCVKQENGEWQVFYFSSLDNMVELKSIGCSLALRDVYDKVPNDPPTQTTVNART